VRLVVRVVSRMPVARVVVRVVSRMPVARVVPRGAMRGVTRT